MWKRRKTTEKSSDNNKNRKIGVLVVGQDELSSAKNRVKVLTQQEADSITLDKQLVNQ